MLDIAKAKTQLEESLRELGARVEGIEADLRDVHDRVQNTELKHFRLVLDIGRDVAQRHRSHALALHNVASQQRQKLWNGTFAQDDVTVIAICR